MAKNLYVTGIGGWLALLVVGLMVLGPLMGFGRLSNEFREALEKHPQLAQNSQWQTYTQVSWLVFAVTSAISISAGYRLWKVHSPESVRFAVMALWLIGPVGAICYFLSMVVSFGARGAAQALPEVIGSFIASCLVATIWTAYLTRSVRVGNTYKTWQPTAKFHSETDTPSESGSVRPQSWWRRRSKNFRLWVFVSIVWAVCVVLYVVVFEPYGSRINDEEFFRMLFTMFVPPIFLGAATYAYIKWIR